MDGGGRARYDASMKRLVAFLGAGALVGGCLLDRGGLGVDEGGVGGAAVGPATGTTSVGPSAGGGAATGTTTTGTTTSTTTATGTTTTTATGTGGAGGAGGGPLGGGGAGGGDPCSGYPVGAVDAIIDGETHCYWYVGFAATQCGAEAGCALVNGPLGAGYLATIHSSQENGVVHGVVPSTSPSDPWIGARRGTCPTGSEVPFTWLTGEPGPDGAFDAWAPDQPAEWYGAVIDVADGAWRATLSGNLRAYVCEAGPLVR